MVFFMKEEHASQRELQIQMCSIMNKSGNLKERKVELHLEVVIEEKNDRVRFGDYITWNLEDNDTLF